MTGPLSDDVTVHRLGGADVPNLRLRPQEERLTPPGFSVLVVDDPADAVAEMRAGFGAAGAWRPPLDVGTATVGAIRSAGFDVIRTTSRVLTNHGRLTHPDGVAGFTDDRLAALSAVFVVTGGY